MKINAIAFNVTQGSDDYKKLAPFIEFIKAKKSILYFEDNHSTPEDNNTHDLIVRRLNSNSVNDDSLNIIFSVDTSNKVAITGSLNTEAYLISSGLLSFSTKVAAYLEASYRGLYYNSDRSLNNPTLFLALNDEGISNLIKNEDKLYGYLYENPSSLSNDLNYSIEGSALNPDIDDKLTKDGLRVKYEGTRKIPEPYLPGQLLKADTIDYVLDEIKLSDGSSIDKTLTNFDDSTITIFTDNSPVYQDTYETNPIVKLGIGSKWKVLDKKLNTNDNKVYYKIKTNMWVKIDDTQF